MHGPSPLLRFNLHQAMRDAVGCKTADADGILDQELEQVYGHAFGHVYGHSYGPVYRRI